MTSPGAARHARSATTAIERDRHQDAGDEAGGRDALEHARHGEGIGRVDLLGASHLARLLAAAASHRDVQALDRSAVRREGSRHRRALSRSAGEGAGHLRRRKEPDPGARSHPAAAADASRTGRAAHARLRAPWHHDAVRGSYRCRDGGDGREGRSVIGKCMPRHRAQEFRKFLDEVERNVPGRPRRARRDGQRLEPQDAN